MPGLHYARTADSLGVFAMEGAITGQPSKFGVSQLQRLAAVPIGVDSSPQVVRKSSAYLVLKIPNPNGKVAKR